MTELFVYGSADCDQFVVSIIDKNTGEPKEILESKIPRIIPFEHKIYRVACGGQHTLLLTTFGKVFSFGCDDDGQLGQIGRKDVKVPRELDTLTSPMTDISAGDAHSVAVNTHTNEVYYWGTYRVSIYINY